MAVPKKRTTSSKRNHRRSHHGLTKLQLSTCSKCQQVVPGHTACPNCGTYKGRQAMDVLAKLEKRERKDKEKELAAQEEAGHDHEGHDHS
ncbi:50S ribosomal protein L32 [bacterium]|nr:50S ribosomal protein L32 [bacterium]